MQKLNRQNVVAAEPPVRVVMFGEGNFLRAFVVPAFQALNSNVDFKAGVAIVQPIARGMLEMLKEQDGLYTLFTKGIKNGIEVEEKELITNVVKSVNPYTEFLNYLKLAEIESLDFIISNTTEAGIAYDDSDTATMQPPNSFPAKLTLLLHRRFTHFSGTQESGLTIIPCELINNNATTLKKYILAYADKWELSSDFKDWLQTACTFHNTLVDRIVPGYPREEIATYNKQLDYLDNLIVSAETFFLWVIEGDNSLAEKLPFHATDLDVKIVGDMQPYRTRKVRILNGAHTAMVPFSLLYGNSTVKETIDEAFTGPFIRKLVFNEIIPTLDMEKEELEVFADAVFDRFRNPFIKHQLASIALNSISKFKVRVLPSLLAYIETKQRLPLYMVFSFACLIRFYKGSWKGNQLPVKDDETIMKALKKTWETDNYQQLADEVLSTQKYWDADLSVIPGLSAAVASALKCIDQQGIQKGFAAYLEKQQG